MEKYWCSLCDQPHVEGHEPDYHRHKAGEEHDTDKCTLCADEAQM